MTGPTHPYRVIDAFTESPFGGNPAAVLILEQALPAASMQTIAEEMNLSETAFVHPADGDGRRLIRWFTPTDEVPLCGHATLASARSLLEDGVAFPLQLNSASGPLEVHREADGRLRLDFPADSPVPTDPPPGLIESLGLPDGAVAAAHEARNLWLVRVQNEATVDAASPDFGAMKAVDAANPAGPSDRASLGVTLTAPGDDPGVDFVSRFFAPSVGVDEDPVTGVAHTVLTPYWSGELGLDEMEARQISSRGGALRVRASGDRVHLIGQAAIVAEGRILLP
jgi:PhzF family phenazine biosynthesis protein